MGVKPKERKKRRKKSRGLVSMIRVERTDEEWAALYEKLKAAARPSRGDMEDRRAVMRMISRQHELAVDARALVSRVRRELGLFMIEHKRGMHVLRQRALVQASDWMRSRGVTGRAQLTTAMVEEEMAANPGTASEYARLEGRRLELEELVRNLEEVAKQWSERTYALNAHAKLVSAEREVKLNLKGRGD